MLQLLGYVAAPASLQRLGGAHAEPHRPTEDIQEGEIRVGALDMGINGAGVRNIYLFVLSVLFWFPILLFVVFLLSFFILPK